MGCINYINEDGTVVFFRNNQWDYIPLDRYQLQESNGFFNLTLIQRWNGIFYLDKAYMVVVDHPVDVNVYSTMVEKYLDPSHMGQIYSVSTTVASPVSAYNEKGEDVLSAISKIDGVFTSGVSGLNSPSWDNVTWNHLTLNLGNLSGAT
jgi:hypothetical protein